MMYVRPIYLRAQDTEGALPELRRVVVVLGNNIGFERTVEQSLRAAITGRGPTVEEEVDGEGETPPEGPSPTEEPNAPSGSVAELLREANEHFENADAALEDGDLARYQSENEAARRAVAEAQRQSE